MSLAAIVFLPLLLGPCLVLWAARRSRVSAAVAAAAVTAAALVVASGLLPEVLQGRTLVERHSWLPQYGLDIAFRYDALAMLFVMLVLAIGLLVILYSHYYLSAQDPAGKFYALLLAFMGAMLGVVVSESMLVLYVFWELTSLTSFLLVGYRTSAQSRQGAQMALAVTVAGGLALLAGILLIGNIAGSYDLSAWVAAREKIRAHPHFHTALVLVLLGAFTKSAQFPFHFWLPAAMAAPTPVSAYLHSATMVKAGVFLLARLFPVLGNSAAFEYIVAGVGLVTFVYGAYVAVFKHDLKGLLAYSTISHLGLIIFLIGLDTPMSSVAAVFHIINHATFKASLFMAAGIIDHESGTRDMRRLSGLWRHMPHTATLAMAAAAAMAGVPLFNGFLSKEMFFGEALELPHLRLLGDIAPTAVTLGGIFSVAYSARFIHDVFFDGEARALPRTPHEPPRYMKVPVEILVVIVMVVGVLPGVTVAPLLHLVGPVVYGAPLPEYHIGLWHGFNLPLLMSVIALAGGVFMYWMLRRHYHLHLHPPRRWASRLLFQRTHGMIVRGSAAITAALENGSLQRYLLFTLVAVMALAASALLPEMTRWHAPDVAAAPPVALAVWFAGAAAALAAVVLHRRRIIAIVLLGIVGLAVAMTFAHYSAPDLALTQLAVEVVTTVLLLAGLGLLPDEGTQAPARARVLRDALLAAVAGFGVAALAWAVLSRPEETIAWYFLENSLPRGGGTNVVNVILVDFRGFDTLGEITVLAIAGLGASLLLREVRLAHSGPLPVPLLLAVTARTLLPFALVVSAYIFLRGHNLPGGGFIAGLVTAVAIVTLYMAEGAHAVERRLPWRYARVIGAGLLVAAGTGAASLFFGLPFLTSAHGHPELPLLGEVPLASAALFDLGVYLAVAGSSLLAVATLAHARAANGAGAAS